MRLTPEQVAEEKKYLSELKERVWFGEHGLTSVEQDLFDTIEALQQENEQLKEQINTAKIGWDIYKTYSEQLEQQTAESNKIIETQRLEIEKLKATLTDWKYNAKCDADHIAALTTDKDELVKVLKKAREAISGYNTCPYCWGVNGHAKGCKFYEALQNIDTLIGGKEE